MRHKTSVRDGRAKVTNEAIDPGNNSLDADKTGNPIAWNEWLKRPESFDGSNVADFFLFCGYGLRERLGLLWPQQRIELKILRAIPPKMVVL